MERKKRYNEKFVAFIERTCQESGDLQPVNDTFYESFIALSNKELRDIAMLILYGTAELFNKKIFSGAWKNDEKLYEFVMGFLELIAEGKLAFNPDTFKMVFLKPLGDPPSDDMWNRIQKRITSSRSAIRAAIIKSVRGDRKKMVLVEPTRQ